MSYRKWSCRDFHLRSSIELVRRSLGLRVDVGVPEAIHPSASPVQVTG